MEILDSVAVVTGGASGLGEAVVRRLAGLGASAAIFDIQEDKGQKLSSELGEKAIFIQTDVSCSDSVQQALNTVVNMFGKINIVINCAGIATPGRVIGKNGVISLDEFSRVIRVNLIGAFDVIRIAVEKMSCNQPNEEGERGIIINTASGAAFEGQIGQAAYSASKAGLVGFTLPLARELAEYGIRVVTIAPGLFATPMLNGVPDPIQLKLKSHTVFPHRAGKESEFAHLVEEIIENPMLNGSTIRLDGALRLPPK